MSCRKILIIEDEPDFRNTIKELLEMEGFSVAAAENGEEGLDLLRRDFESCLIFLDLMMPVMNGWQFLEALKKELEHILGNVPIVVLSAAADLSDVQQKYKCRVLKKPVSISTLLEVAHQYCDQ